MNLYNLSTEYKDFFDRFDEIEALEDDKEQAEMIEAWFDTLEHMNGEIKLKAESIAIFIKNLEAEADAIDAERKRLVARKTTKSNTACRLRKYLVNCLDAAEIEKIDTPKVSVHTRNSGKESTEIADEKKFIKWAQSVNRDDLLSYSVSVSKENIKKAIKEGQDIPFAKVVRTRSVIIK